MESKWSTSYLFLVDNLVITVFGAPLKLRQGAPLKIALHHSHTSFF
jgi:hypothetical protein